MSAPSKDLLRLHYNTQYNFTNKQGKAIKKVIRNDSPRDRYEAMVYWGKGKGKALEIAAGSGEVLAALFSFYDEYIATDLSIERVKYLKELFSKETKVKVVENDIEENNLNFPCEYFDVIIMNSVIEHLIEPISTVKYCYSLLKPGGRILIYTPNIAKWTRRVKLLFGFFPSTGSFAEGFLTYDSKPTGLHDDGHLHYFTFRSLERLLKEKAGFKKIKYCGHGATFLSRILPAFFSECFVIGVK